MTDTILITSTAAGTGKTAIALGLGRLYQKSEGRVGYMKPKGTRLRTRVGKVLDADPILAKEVFGMEESLDTLEPVVYSTTFLQQVIGGGQSPESILTGVEDAFANVAGERDLMILEGADRVSTGALIRLSDVDLARRFDTRTLVVAEYNGLRSLDELLMLAEGFEDRLTGVVFNNVGEESRDELEADVIPFLESRSVPVLGVLPRVRELATVTVGELATEIGAQVLTDVSLDGRVARFVVGAMSSDAALRYFRRTRDAVVVTGGDRPGIQSAALEAPGIRGVVLTGGHRPPSRIISTAASRDIPLLALDGDTLGAIERVESVLGEGRVRSVEDVEQMSELLASHADTEPLLGDV